MRLRQDAVTCKVLSGIGIIPHVEREIKRGQLVTVRDAWGRKLSKKVFAVSGVKVWVCSPEEFENAMRERREPKGIGFPKEDVEPVVSR
jgi:hypothetical protein